MVILLIVPIFEGLFASIGGELPALTQLLLDMSEILNDYFVVSVLICFIMVILTLSGSILISYNSLPAIFSKPVLTISLLVSILLLSTLIIGIYLPIFTIGETLH